MIPKSSASSVQSYQTPLLATGVAILGFLFFWEIGTDCRQLSAWSLIPLLVGIAIFELIVRFPLGTGVARPDKGITFPFISKPLYFYHGVLLVTLFLLGPANQSSSLFCFWAAYSLEHTIDSEPGCRKNCSNCFQSCSRSGS